MGKQLDILRFSKCLHWIKLNNSENIQEHILRFTKGGMGEIYKGTSPDGTMVAIKRIPKYSLRGSRLERFLREIEVVQQLSHPNIVKMLNVNKDEGYYVMEWADSGILEYRLKQSKTLPPKEALRVTAQIADALTIAHEKTIIHRDIKPQNILLFSGNVAKLTDFGIAHVERAETLTGTGVQVGTLRYMSPEQYMAEEIDSKTDIFSLGLVLFEMLTGDIPFMNPKELCQKDIEDLERICKVKLPEDIMQIIFGCLRNNSLRRYSDSELKEMIRQCIEY